MGYTVWPPIRGTLGVSNVSSSLILIAQQSETAAMVRSSTIDATVIRNGFRGLAKMETPVAAADTAGMVTDTAITNCRLGVSARYYEGGLSLGPWMSPYPKATKVDTERIGC